MSCVIIYCTNNFVARMISDAINAVFFVNHAAIIILLGGC